MHTKTVTISAISCNHCVMTIKRELADVEGVGAVEADAATKKVTVTWDDPATWGEIAALLDELGYPPEE